MTKSRLLSPIAFVAGLSASMLMSTGAFAASISLGMDQVRVVTLKTPFKAISVGNPVIAEATVIDETHIFLVGREFGTTNLVAVDDEGNQVADDLITVTGPQGAMMTVQRGPSWSTLTCSNGRCDVRPLPGDEIERYRNDTTAIQVREGLAKTAVPDASSQ